MVPPFSMSWHKKLPTPGSAAARIRASSNRMTGGLRLRVKPRVRKPEHAFYKEYSNTISLDGYRVKTTTRYQMAKLFNVGLPAILKWEALGVLPPPIMYNSRGRAKVPVYLSSQIRCLLMVVNDLIVDGGYVSIPWAVLPEHVEMLHEGYREALNNFHRRAGYMDEGRVDKGDKFGVTLL